jgi:serine/threonine-protein kinase
MKGFGKLAEGENIILQHVAQDSGMVLGQQLVYQAGFSPKPEGNITEQFLQAEAMNLQMSAGMALGQGLAPGLAALSPSERGIFRRAYTGRNGAESEAFEPFGKLALEGASDAEVLKRPVVMMSEGEGDGGKKGGVPPPRPNRISLISIPANESLVGKIIDGRYEVMKAIGKGGMGVVYKCIHKGLNKEVAMKVLLTNVSGNTEVIERFRNEAKAASSVRNKHIIDITDIGRLDDGSTYFIMEYLEGIPLAKLVEGDKPVPVPRLLNIAQQIAEGLSAAHAKDVVHRDLKPGNIHLIEPGTEKESVKILDFGIAKLLNSEKPELTLAGAVLGTPSYMSPEQARGEAVDHRADIYSLGVILYRMASGKLPFKGDFLEVMQKHKSEPPKPIRQIIPPPQEVPPLLDEIILRCLAKRPEDRYQSMEEVIVDLKKLAFELSEKPLVLVRARPPLSTPPPAEQRPPVIRVTPPPPSTPPPNQRLSPTPTPPTAVTKVKPAPVTPEPQAKEEPKKTRWPLYVGITGLGAASVVVAALFASGKLQFPSNTAPTPSVPPPPPTPSPSPTVTDSDGGTPSTVDSVSPDNSTPDAGSPPPPPPSSKKIELTVDPADARVFKDGKELEKPWKLEVEPGKSVEIGVHREGYKTKKVTLDDSQEKVTVHLERDVKPPHPPIPPPDATPKPEKPFEPFE